MECRISYFIGNFDEIPYEIRKKPSGQDRTAAEGKGKHRLLLVSV